MKLKLVPKILHEEPDGGKSIIEKLEHNASGVTYAIVILTPDDLGRPKEETLDSPRPRQNVILELGYFMGLLGRKNVCPLKKGEMELPSDYDGVVYTPMDEHCGWHLKLAREMRNAGIDVDMSLLG
jgi:predicted nucleotide-binding protein